MERLNKYIASCGICSRRAADKLIESGKVSINNKIEKELGFKVKEDSDVVCVDGKKIEKSNKKIYILLNKPKGYVTTSKEQFNRKCVLDLIKEKIRVFPVGRLDMNTEGLLLLTNDGDFANKVIHPKNEIEKTYIVTTNKKITYEDINILTQGVDIGDYITKPAKVKLIDEYNFEIKITEGKNRQIRRMCLAVNIFIKNLKRVSIGKLTLGNLPLGKYIVLNKNRVKEVFSK